MTKQTLHEKVTHQIIDAMESATNFQMPWHIEQELPINALTNNKYQGINTVSLWSNSMRKHYDSSHWATYRQWQELDAQVQKGERGSTIIIYKPITNRDGEIIYSTEPPYKPKVLIRSANVFNANQVSGWEPPNASTEPIIDLTSKLNNADTFVSNSKATITTGGSQAYYNHKTDIINMPKRKLFTGTSSSTPTEGYYSTLLHELVHWTGFEKRCNRDLSGRFGKHAYAREELIAELGSAFLCAELGITKLPRTDHASYIKSWIKVLKEDVTAIFLAASKATTAVCYLNSLQFLVKSSDYPLSANH